MRKVEVCKPQVMQLRDTREKNTGSLKKTANLHGDQNSELSLLHIQISVFFVKGQPGAVNSRYARDRGRDFPGLQESIV